MVRKSFPVAGLGCAACVAKVQSALESCPGVAEANVSLASNLARVDFDESVTTEQTLRNAVRKAGYDLVTADEAEADEASEKMRRANLKSLKRDLAGAVLLTAVLMGISMLAGNFAGKSLIVCLLSLTIILLFGRRFFISAARLLRHGGANMDTLVALSVSISFAFSLFNMLCPEFWTSRGLKAHLYFDSSAMIITFILIGRVIEEHAKAGASSAVRKLIGLQPKTVAVLRREPEGGELAEMKLPVAEIVVGDIVLVRPGERVPVDGKVTEGGSYIDESMLTGEPEAVHKACGDKVWAGTICKDGFLKVETLKLGRDTMLASIISLVRDAQGSKVKIQNIVDRIAGVFVPVIACLSLLALILWTAFGGNDGLVMGLLAMVNVLVIACPCSLGLATPTAIVAGIGKGAEEGILIRDADSLQVAGRVDVVVMDKTGTLTSGKPVVSEIVWFTEEAHSGDRKPEAVLYAMESRSAHPLAGALASYLEPYKDAALSPDSFKDMPGIGIKAQFGDEEYFAGKHLPPYVEKNEKLMQEMDRLKNHGGSIVCFASRSEGILALVSIEDAVRESALEAVKALHKDGIQVHILTGDNKAAAMKVCKQVGADNIEAEVLPARKSEYVGILQSQGLKVAMVGDGINDSAALAKADLSIAMGQGSDIAIETAMVTITSSDLRRLPALIKLSRKSNRIMAENLFWAFFYNIVMIPLAAGLLTASTGLMLNPMICAAAMVMSSICVVCNSLRLKLSSDNA